MNRPPHVDSWRHAAPPLPSLPSGGSPTTTCVCLCTLQLPPAATSSSSSGGWPVGLARDLLELHRESVALVDSMRVAATWTIHAQAREQLRRRTTTKTTQDRTEEEEATPASDRITAGDLPRLPRVGRPPVVPLSCMCSFLTRVVDLHRRTLQPLTACMAVRLWEIGAYQERARKAAAAAAAATTTPEEVAQPTPIPFQFDWRLMLATRFLLQYLPLLPPLIGALCHPADDASAAYSLELVRLHQPLAESLLAVIYQLYLSDYNANDPALTPKVAVPLDNHHQTQQQRAPPGVGAPIRKQPQQQQTRVVVPPPNHAVLDHVSAWLTGLDVTLSFRVFHRAQTAQGERYRIPPANLDGSPNNQLNFLRQRCRDLVALVRQGELQGELPQRGGGGGGGARGRGTTHVPMHERMCASALDEFRMLQAEAARPCNHDRDEQQQQPQPPLLPETFVVRACHLFYEEVDRLVTPLTTPDALFSQPFLRLLEPLLCHSLGAYDAYLRRFHRLVDEQERGGVSASGRVEGGWPAATRWSAGGPTAPSGRRPIPSSLPSAARVPALSSSSAAPVGASSASAASSSSYAYYRTVDLFLHFVDLHRARWLSRVPLEVRGAFYCHLPESFEVDLHEVICGRLLPIYTDLARVAKRYQQMDDAMRDWWGIEPRDNQETTDPPSCRLAALSPFLSYGLRSSVVISSTVFVRRRSAWQLDRLPLALYQRALVAVERLCVDTNSDLAADLLHWLHCVAANRIEMDAQWEKEQQQQKADNQPTVEEHPRATWRLLIPRALWPLGALLHAYPATNRSVDGHLHPLVHIWRAIQRLVHPRTTTTSSSASNGGSHISTSPPPPLPAPAAANGQAPMDEGDPTPGGASVPPPPEGTPPSVRLSTCTSAPGVAAVSVWLLLVRCRHVLDHAFFLFTQSSLPTEAPTFRALVSLLAFHLAPTDDRLQALVRDHLTEARELLAPESVSVGPSVSDSAAALNSFFDRLWRATDRVASIRPSVLSLLAPLVDQQQPAAIASFLDRLWSIGDRADRRLPAGGVGVGSAYTQLVRQTQRWIVGALLAAIHQRTQPTPTEAPSSSGPSSPSVVPLQLACSISLLRLLEGIQRRQQATPSADLPPCQDVRKDTVATLHPMLADIFNMKKKQ